VAEVVKCGGFGFVAEPLVVTSTVPVAEVHFRKGIGEAGVGQLEDDVPVRRPFSSITLMRFRMGSGRRATLPLRGWRCQPRLALMALARSRRSVGREGGGTE
jgi:hypothetical protein